MSDDTIEKGIELASELRAVARDLTDRHVDSEAAEAALALLRQVRPHLGGARRTRWYESGAQPDFGTTRHGPFDTLSPVRGLVSAVLGFQGRGPSLRIPPIRDLQRLPIRRHGNIFRFTVLSRLSKSVGSPVRVPCQRWAGLSFECSKSMRLKPLVSFDPSGVSYCLCPIRFSSQAHCAGQRI